MLSNRIIANIFYAIFGVIFSLIQIFVKKNKLLSLSYKLCSICCFLLLFLSILGLI